MTESANEPSDGEDEVGPEKLWNRGFDADKEKQGGLSERLQILTCAKVAHHRKYSRYCYLLDYNLQDTDNPVAE